MIMMRYVWIIMCLATALRGNSQSLQDINYNYLYNAELFTFDLKPVRQGNEWTLFYALQVKDASQHSQNFTVYWEGRQSLSEKSGTPLPALSIRDTLRNRQIYSGKAILPVEGAPNIIVARVVQETSKRTWIFYQVLDPQYPVNQYVMAGNKVSMKAYLNINDSVSLPRADTTIGSYFNDNFPAALPPFAESQGRVSPGIFSDSTFTVLPGQVFTISQTGLYLLQRDTTATEGIAFRVEDDYPKAAKIRTLAGPLMYVCTRDELNRLTNAKNDKKAFDRLILSITEDTERARRFIRNYFRRVEQANEYFTSYKEGWKTDRGMIYIIFGLPEEVFKFSDREVWRYNNDRIKLTFNFSKSGSIFDPDNYVLIRDNKYRETWLETVDLWRKARF